MPYDPQTPSTYVSPLASGQEFEFVSAHTIYPYDVRYGVGNGKPCINEYIQKVLFNGIEIFNEQYKVSHDLSSTDIEGTNNGVKINLSSGIYEVFYSFKYRSTLPDSYTTKTATYRFQVVQNQYPPKKFTVKDVVERILLLCEPLVVERDTALPGYISEVQKLIKNIDDPGGVDKFFDYLDLLYKKGGQGRNCAITFYTNMQQSLINLVGNTKFEDMKKAKNDAELEESLGDAINGLSIDDLGNFNVRKRVEPTEE